MIIKQPPNFFPLTAERSSPGPLAGPERGAPSPEVFAALLKQGRLSGEALSGLPQTSPDIAADLFGAVDAGLDESDFSSVLTTVMQLAASAAAGSAGTEGPVRQAANLGEMRRAISAYAPQYMDGGLRQKIDFSARASFPDPLESLTERVVGHQTRHGAATPAARDVKLESRPDNPGLSSPSDPIQPTPSREASPGLPGFLAARFESRDMPDAIGYDRRGGTCYGVYQLSSRMGTMDAFLSYLDKQAPDWADRLRAAGPANTRGRGGAMPREWRRISAEAPEMFARLQHDFISDQYFKPAVRAVRRRLGLEPGVLSPALREVIWSTAVQHGVSGAANIFERAASRVPGKAAQAEQERELIKAVYAERGKRFTGSTRSVRASVQERFAEEMQLALALLPQTMNRQV